MDWLNIHIPTLIRSPEYIGSSPAERGTWLSVLAYACQTECGGVLAGAADWKDRQWQQACGVTLDEVRAADRLLRTIGRDIHVNGYPLALERQAKKNRKSAKAGAMARWRDAKPVPPGNAAPMPPGIPPGNAGSMPPPDAKGEGEGEGKGEVRRQSHPSATDSQDLFAPTAPQPQTPAPIKRVPASEIDHLRHGGAEIGRDEGGVWQLLVDDHGRERVIAAVRQCLSGGDRAFYRHVAPLLRDPQPERLPAPAPSPKQIAERIVMRDGWEACRAHLPAWAQTMVTDHNRMLDAIDASDEVADALIAARTNIGPAKATT